MILSLGVASAYADHNIGDPIPGGLLVSAGGLQWVWAGPCAPLDPSCGAILDFRGFVIPTAADYLASWADNATLFAAMTGKCASSYFDDVSNFDHCDEGDLAIAGSVNNPFGPYGAEPLAEALLIRRGVPEPATLTLLGAGIAALWFRKRSAV